MEMEEIVEGDIIAVPVRSPPNINHVRKIHIFVYSFFRMGTQGTRVEHVKIVKKKLIE